MSYRNPQIIVDRSAEIWAQGMSQFAANIAQGFSNYVEIKKEAKRKQNKIEEARNKFVINAELKYAQEINKEALKIKDRTVQDEFREIMTKRSDAAIKAQTALAFDNIQDRNIIKEYRDTVTGFQTYMTNSKADIEDYISKTAFYDEISAHKLVTNYSVNGQGVTELGNLATIMASRGKSPDGLSYTKHLTANEDNTNSLKYSFVLDKDSSTFRSWDDAGVFYDKSQYTEKDGKIHFDVDRNLSLLRSENQGEILTEIPAAIDMNSLLMEAGIVDKKGAAKDAYFVDRTTQQTFVNKDGSREVLTEKVLDYDKVANTQAFKDQIKMKAEGLDAMSQQDQISFIQSRFGWGNITRDEYFKKSREQRIQFLEGQIEEQALAKLGDMRDVTDEDVERLSGVMSGISTTRINAFGQEVPNKIIVQKGPTQKIPPPPRTGESYESQLARDYVQRFSNPEKGFKGMFEIGEGYQYEDIKTVNGKTIITYNPVEYKVDDEIKVQRKKPKEFELYSDEHIKLVTKSIKTQRGQNKETNKISDLVRKYMLELRKQKQKQKPKPTSSQSNLIFDPNTKEFITREQQVAVGLTSMSDKQQN